MSMTQERRQFTAYGLVTDGLGTVLSTHEAGACDVTPCPFHSPSVWPLVLAELKWVAGVGLVRICPHEIEHPDVDDLMAQVDVNPMLVKTIQTAHDRICDGCCVGIEPVAPAVPVRVATPGDDDATQLISIASLNTDAIPEVEKNVTTPLAVVEKVHTGAHALPAGEPPFTPGDLPPAVPVSPVDPESGGLPLA